VILVYLPIITITEQRRPKHGRRILDKALDDKGQRRKLKKCEGVREEFYYL